MPNIRSSTNLYNGYYEKSPSCHQSGEPVFITKNGKGDLAVMSMEACERLPGRAELYGLLQHGIGDIQSGNTRCFSEVLSDLRARCKA